MARKTMADRYAAQRSRRDTHRRSLPRLSDATFTALADHDDEQPYGSADEESQSTVAAPKEPAVTMARRPQQAAMPRRSPALGRTVKAMPASAIAHVDYHYVLKDLRRIAVTAVAMFVLLVVLNVIVQHVIVIH